MTFLEAMRAACDGREIELDQEDGILTVYNVRGKLVGVVEGRSPDGLTPICNGVLVEITGGDANWPNWIGTVVQFGILDIKDRQGIVRAIDPTERILRWEVVPVTGE